MTGSWTLGVLINQLFSIANTGDLPRKSVSQMFVQPFVSYVTKNTVTFSLETETTINWEVSNDNRWSVPIELEVSKLTKLGPFPFSVQAGGGIFVTSPSGGPDWRLRLSFTVLLPEKKTPHKK
jgi:hypothetical protein